MFCTIRLDFPILVVLQISSRQRFSGTLDVLRFLTLGDSYHLSKCAAIFQIVSSPVPKTWTAKVASSPPVSWCFLSSISNVSNIFLPSQGPRGAPIWPMRQGREARGRLGAPLATGDVPPSAQRAAGAAEAEAAAAGAPATAPGLVGDGLKRRSQWDFTLW